jgi:hypothetical protein
MSSHDSDDGAAIPDEAAAAAEDTTNVNDKLISALMARIMPDISRLILSSVGQAGRPLPRPVENASFTIIASTSAPPSVSSNLQPATTEQQQQAPTWSRPLPSLVSVSGSDPTLNVHGLQRELSAAADTFRLDHLDDDIQDQFPAYVPDYVLSAPQMGSPSRAHEDTPPPLIRTFRGALPTASPASPFGLLRPSSSTPPVVPLRAIGVTTYPGAVSPTALQRQP